MEAAATGFPEGVLLLLKNKAVVKKINHRDPQGMSSEVINHKIRSQFWYQFHTESAIICLIFFDGQASNTGHPLEKFKRFHLNSHYKVIVLNSEIAFGPFIHTHCDISALGIRSA